MRRSARRSATLLSLSTIVALAVGGLALADPDPGSVPGAVSAFTGWSESPRKDIQDRATGQYQFEAQAVGGARRAVASASSRYTAGRLTSPSSLRVELQALYDAVLHDRPNPPDNNLQETAHPDLQPDWNGNGQLGVDDPSDYDLDLDAHRDVAMFRYPVFHDDGTITHPAGSGVAMEAGFVNSRGLLVDATLWVPGDLVQGMDAQSDIVTLRTEKRPAIAFASGISSSQVDYYWFAESMAARGYVVLTYDPVGQGQSEGTWSDTFQQGAGTGDCGFGGACLDVQDAVRWLVGTPITPRTDLTGLENGQVRPFDPAKDPAGGPLNPISKLVDVRNVGLAGNSMGALSTLNYLTTLASGSSPDGRPLPLVKAAVAMSGATPGATTKVPLQLQTSDFDGSPTLVGPGLGGVSLGGAGQGIGYYPIKDMFDRIRPNASRDLSLVVMAGGVHTDHVAVPYVPRTLWSIHLASHYAGAWFDCYIKGSGRACAATRVGIAHLSSAFGSELDPTGPANELCLATPTTMSLNYDAQDLAALRPRSCHGRANP